MKIHSAILKLFQVEDDQMSEKIGTVVLIGYAQKHECPYKGRITICIKNNTKFQSAQLVLLVMYQPITTNHKVGVLTTQPQCCNVSQQSHS
jgi:hypothetical protein